MIHYYSTDATDTADTNNDVCRIREFGHNWRLVRILRYAGTATYENYDLDLYVCESCGAQKSIKGHYR